MHSVPAVVAAAIENYNPENSKVLRPPSRKKRSFIFNWGVRVGSEANEDPVLKWICLASQACREQHRSFTLSNGNTSKAAKHLREAHGVESGKTLAQAERERSHDEEMASVRRSPLFRNDPARAYLLLETCRIVNNNLPFCLDEYEESLAIRDLVYKNAMQVTVNAKAVRHSIIELYTSTKTEIIAMIAANHIGSAKTFTIVADFWTSKPIATKFLGLRLYLVDAQFRFKSILLRTRHFKPLYGDRDGGIRGPFQRWIVEILREFGLSQHDVHGSTTDGGSDVKWMMQEGLKLSWEWCLPHLTHAQLNGRAAW